MTGVGGAANAAIFVLCQRIFGGFRARAAVKAAPDHRSTGARHAGAAPNRKTFAIVSPRTKKVTRPVQ
jgi:hypothetical protein